MTDIVISQEAADAADALIAELRPSWRFVKMGMGDAEKRLVVAAHFEKLRRATLTDEEVRDG